MVKVRKQVTQHIADGHIIQMQSLWNAIWSSISKIKLHIPFDEIVFFWENDPTYNSHVFKGIHTRIFIVTDLT